MDQYKPIKPTNHNMKRRAGFHDYTKKGFYMITLVLEGRKPLFGSIEGNPHPHVSLSSFGYKILTEELPKISLVYPNVDVWKSMIMPDHIHFILSVVEEFPPEKHLGSVIVGFKSGCNRAWRAISGASSGSIFEEGYNDKILVEREVMERWKHYIDENPRRLWIKRTNPQLFTVMRDQSVCGTNCQMVGNPFLLDIPDKKAVIVHRSDSDEVYQRKFNEWMTCGERGGVLVGTSISPREKAVMREAMNRGYRIILLRENGFPQFYKPAGEAFNACSAGQLLQISPWEYHTQRITITRDKCLYLNTLAEKIAATGAYATN